MISRLIYYIYISYLYFNPSPSLSSSSSSLTISRTIFELNETIEASKGMTDFEPTKAACLKVRIYTHLY